jgi:predicted MPP superfamily phosphohydrolase
MIAEAIRLGLGRHPDLVTLTGDFVTGRLGPGEGYARELSRLVDAAPTFACLGNHDGMPTANPARHEPDDRAVSRLLRQAGIGLLVNERARVRLRGVDLEVAGLGDLWAGRQDPARCLDVADRGAGPARLLLNHNPDARAALMPFAWDLMLCGHTHGGQVGFPWLARRLAPVRDKSHLEGLQEREGRLIHITRGVGNLHGLRFGCRPQVSVLTIV